MKRTSLLLFCLAVLTVFRAKAQELPQVIPPSPTVANLMAFEEVPIDYYSGQPNISIPIYSKQIGPSASLSIALRYNTQGVKIDSRSSWVGTGWSLDIGGVISRTVRGIPDDEPADADTRLGVWHNDDFWNYDNLNESATLSGNNIPAGIDPYNFDYSEKDEFMWKAKGTSADQYDTEVDLFQFSLLGASGRFVIVKEYGSLVPKLLDKSQNVKIEFTPDPVTLAINSFTVTDAYGYKYIFDKKEITTAEPVSASVSQRPGDLGTAPITGTSDYIYTSAWYLTAIETGNGIELAGFAYEPSTESYLVSRTVTENHITDMPNSGFANDILANDYNLGVLKPRVSVSYFSNTVNGFKPSKVTFKDRTSVELSTSDTRTHPETNGKILTSISIKDENDLPLNVFSFDTETVSSRLWLDKVSEYVPGVNMARIYTLNYHQRQFLPVFGSTSDEWGYYNGTELSIIPQAFDKDLIKTGLLSSIDYPTGGRQTYTFEHNTFSHGAGNALSNDQYWQNPDNYDLLVLTKTFTDEALNLSGPNNQFGSQLFSLNLDQKVYFTIDLEATETTTGSGSADNYLANPSATGPFDPVNNMLLRVEDSQGNVVVNIPVRNEEFITFSELPEGTNYSMYLITPQVSGWELNGDIKLHYKSKKASINSHFWYGGGVRIKEVAFYEDANAITPERKWTYSYNDASDATKSSGAVDALLGNLSREYQVTNKKYLFSGDDMTSSFGEETITYQVFSQGANAQVTKGGYVGYKTITVEETGNGKVVNTYTNAQDYSNAPGVFIYPFDPPANLDYKRGLLLNSIVYNEGGDKLKETTNLYDFDTNTEVVATSRKLYNDEMCGWLQFYDLFSFFVRSEADNMPTCQGTSSSFPCISPLQMQNCGGNTNLSFKTENVEINWAQLVETTEIDYTYKSGVQSSTQSKKTFVYNTTNFQQKEVNHYYNEGGLERHHQTKIYYPVGGLPTSHDYSAGELSVINTDMVALNDINTVVFTEEFKDGRPLSKVQNVFEDFGTDLIKLKETETAKGDASLESRIIIHSYDDMGNPLEVSKTGGVRIAYLWGYKGTRPVAQITNATHSQVLSLLSPAQLAALDDPVPGIKNNQYDYQALRDVITHIRTHPTMSNAQVIGMTYDRNLGMLSQTDPNGLTTTYEYDLFGRLTVVRDPDGNIVSTNTYHYRGQ